METAARFEAKIMPEPTSGCWLWTASFHTRGYGLFQGKSRGRWQSLNAHRVAWGLYRGDIPPGLSVLHRCDVRSCVNPDHLFLGTQADNMADMVAKGRSARGLRSSTGRLTDEALHDILTSPGTATEAARRHGISVTHACRIRHGRARK